MCTAVHPIIATDDLARASAFWIDLLGAVVEEQVLVPGGDADEVFYLRLRLGDSVLGLNADDGTRPGGVRAMALHVTVDDLTPLLAGLDAAGAELTGSPTDMPWGERVAHVLDPDGNPVNLAQPI